MGRNIPMTHRSSAFKARMYKTTLTSTSCTILLFLFPPSLKIPTIAWPRYIMASLLSILVEIRLMIYQYLLVSSPISKMRECDRRIWLELQRRGRQYVWSELSLLQNFATDPKVRPPHRVKHFLHPAILETCKTIHNEGRAILYGSNAMSITSSPRFYVHKDRSFILDLSRTSEHVIEVKPSVFGPSNKKNLRFLKNLTIKIQDSQYQNQFTPFVKNLVTERCTLHTLKVYLPFNLSTLMRKDYPWFAKLALLIRKLDVSEKITIVKTSRIPFFLQDLEMSPDQYYTNVERMVRKIGKAKGWRHSSEQLRIAEGDETVTCVWTMTPGS